MLDDLSEQVAAFIAEGAARTSDRARSEACRDEDTGALRWIIAAAVIAAMLASAIALPRRRAIGIHARRPHALRCVRPAAQDRSRGSRRHHPCRVRARRLHAAQRKIAELGQDVGQGRHDLLWALPRQLVAAAAGAGRWRPHSGRHHMGLSRRRHSHPDWPRLHRGCAAARLGDGARDGAYRAARYARPLRVAVGGPCGLCRAGRAGAGRRSHRAGNLAGHDARHAEGPAASRRPGPRQHRHLGTEILGRRDVLPACRYRNPQSDQQSPRPAGCDARRDRRRRQSRAGLVDRPHSRNRRQGRRRRRADASSRRNGIETRDARSRRRCGATSD